MTNLNFIDLFAGASGLSEGFIKAGFNPIAHIEMNEDACFTIKTRTAFHYLSSVNKIDIYIKYLKKEITRTELYSNIPSKIIDSVLNIEITDQSIESIFSTINKLQSKKNIDLIIGGPPCQAYSLIGRHQKKIGNDPRNKLYVQYGKFLEEYKPKAFVFENVPGLFSANKGEHFKNMRTYFKKIGYNVYYDTLIASDYGVLQNRKRIIIVGWLKEYDFGFPNPEKITKKYIVNDIFFDLPKLNPGDGENIMLYTHKENEYLSSFGIRKDQDILIQHITRPHNQKDLSIYEYVINKWNKERKRIKYTDLPKELQTHKNNTSFLDRYKVVDNEGVSHTIVAHIAKDGHYYIHPEIEQCRSISVREAARLQSFPDDFYFEGSRSSAFKQIGNAVPPLMSYAIANKIKELLCQ